MMKLNICIKLALLSCAIVATSSFAHSGRTNAEGCHTNRKTGDYHCHGGKSQRVDYLGQNEISVNKSTSSQSKGTKSSTVKKSTSSKKIAKPRSGAAQAGNDFTSRIATPLPDPQVQCVNSKNVNVYWEPVTHLCLDRTTGREAAL